MYESFFGLSGKPFSLNPDPDFFFGSRGHKRAMAYLEYGLHQAEGFIVITGEVGAGKTTLVRNLLRKLPVDAIVPVQIVSTQLDADDTLRLVAASFGVRDTSMAKSDLLLRLEEHLREIHRDGKRALLVVDEAQNLTPRAVEELRMLSNFQIDTKSLLQSFLIGQPEFRQVMQRPEMRQLKQRIIASYHLGPMDRIETQQYIEHRLHHVGWNDDPHFDAGAFDRIFEATAGVPRRINTLCDRLLLACFLGERHVIAAADVDEARREIVEELGESEQHRAEMIDAPASGLSDAIPGGGGLDAELQALLRTDAPAAVGLADRVARLEDRIALLEASTNMMYGTMKRVLRVLREQQGVSTSPREAA